jgi:catechol 2,3-dioxygenase
MVEASRGDSRRIGRVDLTVTDLDRSLAFYRDVLGLVATSEPDGRVLLAEPGGEVLLAIASGATAPATGGAGLYHVALLVPRRRDLGRVLAGLRDAGWRLQGAADHTVSEALYLADPDGHGIEIYADRPRAMWRRLGEELVMVTEPLDVRGLLAEAVDEREPAWSGLPAGTTVGHVHLNVGDLGAAERLFSRQLGMAVTTRAYPGALFLAYDGYHHHVGANVWWRSGRGHFTPGAARLARLEVLVSADQEVPAAPLAGTDDAFEIVVRPG